MPTIDGHFDPTIQQCIQNCNDAQSSCLRTMEHCLGLGGKHAQGDHIRLFLNCAQICRANADFMLTGSPFYHLTCAACAVLCAQCADSCEAVGPDDAVMLACADTCRRAEATCKELSRDTRQVA